MSFISHFLIAMSLFSYVIYICVIVYIATKVSHGHSTKTSNSMPHRSVSNETCQQRNYGWGLTVCVCNSTFCDVLYEPQKLEAPNYLIYTSNKAGSRFKKTQGVFVPLNINVSNTIYVDSKRKFQEILGFGGAITDSTGININDLSNGSHRNLMRSYFGKVGIGYNFIRLPIGASDFSPRGYTYDDSEKPDPELIHFKLAPEDYTLKIPLIHEAMLLANNNIKIVAAAWACPSWMKTIPGYSVILSELKTEMYQPWAEYHKKFLDAYKENNITIWGISTGNEPTIGFIPISIPSLGFTPKTLSNWIAYNLGPTLRNSSHSDVKILALDEQRTVVTTYMTVIAQDPKALNYLDGIALHWYTDKYAPNSVLQLIHYKFPNKFLLGTELCRGNGVGEVRVILGSWDRGEDYAAGMIENLKNWFVGWIDWNMVLDLNGGPSFFKMGADSPIIVNKNSDEFYKQPSFYVMGHFSKFIPPGSIRIDVSQYDFRVLTIGFQRPDGGIALIIVNLEDIPIDVTVVDKQRKQQARLFLTGRSISTILYW